MVNMNKAENGRDLQEEIWVILPPQTASSASYCGYEPPSTAGRERPTVVSRDNLYLAGHCKHCRHRRFRLKGTILKLATVSKCIMHWYKDRRGKNELRKMREVKKRIIQSFECWTRCKVGEMILWGY